MALFAALLPFLSMSQDNNASAESEAYHETRQKTSVPPYGLDKVKKLLGKTTSDESDNTILAAKDYLSLTLREKFTYHMIHAETYLQNCDIILTEKDEEKKIFGHLPEPFNESVWSARQTDFLEANRDSVMALIKESVNRSGRMGVNYKHALVEIRALEMIPFLVEFYKRDRKDHDVLTVLMLLMKGAKYEPFTSSASYGKLYGKESSYHAAFLVLNTANEDLIMKRAMDLFNAMS
ncbi:hypothetical protein SAMN05421788_11723 [Filimonas lacunae]|uniref:Uncharacterized protein n=2 Tax=Filimonas lacunae TaxID=477680 RepID=A0A173ME82_9BACT|nr:hypothetical protein FLA_1915 [Filimonas lacunae]SIT34540.1 hypothetical protein SAMN05421788_11723 [Filimonas lacunae]